MSALVDGMRAEPERVEEHELMGAAAVYGDVVFQAGQGSPSVARRVG